MQRKSASEASVDFWRGSLGVKNPSSGGVWTTPKTRSRKASSHRKSVVRSAAKSATPYPLRNPLWKIRHKICLEIRREIGQKMPIVLKFGRFFCLASPLVHSEGFRLRNWAGDDFAKEAETQLRCKCAQLALGPTALAMHGAQWCLNVVIFSKITSVVVGWVCQSNLRRLGRLHFRKGGWVGPQGASPAGLWENLNLL